MSETCDVVVIGMGPGGDNVAETLAAQGLSVAGIEANLVGGECPYWGCIPSKMMIRASTMIAETRRASNIAGSAHITPDWSLVAKRIRDEATDNWDDKVAVNRFESKGGRFYRGHGKLIGNNEVQVGDIHLIAQRGIVIATGSAPFVPPIPGLADVSYWTNHEAIECDDLPASLIVLGGGAIGAELAQVFARFGVAVTVIESSPRVLAREEPEASAIVEAAFKEDGIVVKAGARAESVRQEGHHVVVSLGSEEVRAEKLLVAVGRRNNLKNLGLDAIGIVDSQPSIPVDENMRVADKVWALGDITGKGAFTHISMYQSNIVIDEILGKSHLPAEYHALPRVTFTDPEVGSVGLSEDDARKQYSNIRVGTYPLENSTRGWIHKAGNSGVIKLIEDADRGVLVGATSVGPTGGEVLGLLTLAVQERTPVANLRHLVYAYPTFHRAIEAALAELK